ncbi:MAG TPA: PLP-dependent aspartate aminotransferase family protein [Candidatus Bathyarchaeia archaeon]|nr:PLP-dependent aspartate aminotransferase family protein [Candidatus Bathyarchaeia archaeon]
MNYKYGINTKLVHAGERPSPDTFALAPPIYQTSSFALDEVLPSGTKRGKYVYSRFSNPTLTALELKMAALEGGDAAVSFATGMGAISAIMLTLLKCGDHMVADQVLYGSTYELLKKGAPRLGFDVSFVDTSDPDNVAKAVKDNTKLVFFETPANPTLKLVDIQAVAEVASESKVKTVVDNTFLTPYYQRPLELGADMVVHSATKYLNGHGDALGGIVVTSFEEATTLRKGVLRDMGAALSPFNAFLILRGIRTLAVRMERHSQNAFELAAFLKAHKAVKQVFYPGFDQNVKPNSNIKKQMEGFGGMLAFRIRGGLQDAVTFLNNLRLCTVAVSLGDTATLVEHPGLMTHSVVPNEERDALGITDDLIRVSSGLEDMADVKADLEQALDKI